MEFTIFTPRGGSKSYSGDDVGYSLKDSGALVAWDSDRKMTFSPSGWTHMDEPGERRDDITQSVH